MVNYCSRTISLLSGALVCARLGLAAGTVGGVLCFAAPVAAQSAADKATARKLATAGIKLYQQSKFEEALDRLKRAQALYDAPVHLLYMARAQVQLGQLVEGTESYRRLVRAELEPKAPDVFRQAIMDGEKELAEVEPRIPALTISVEPSSAEGLQISLDGETISVAVLGVERPVNPGERQVVAEAPGYLKAESSVTLAEGESQQVALTMEVDPNAPKEEPGEAAGSVEPGRQEASAPVGDDSWRSEQFAPEAVGFFLGLRLGGLFPSGSLQQDLPTADFIGSGGGGELHGGVRFLRNFGVKLFLERYFTLPGTELDAAPAGLDDAQFEVTSTAYATSFGLSGIVGTQRGRIGGYGELGIALLHEYGWEREIVDTNTEREPNFDPCKESVAFKGAAFRIGGSFVFPVHRNVQLTAVAMATVGNFNSSERTFTCSGLAESPGETQADIINKELHQQLFIGVGGDFVFGPG